jgi:hypothetical protein
MTEEPLFIVYRNWRGEVGVREIYPKSVYFGITEWHPEPQWFLLARDEDKGATRDFAFADILSLHRNFDDAESSMRAVEEEEPVAVDDEFDLKDQPIRLKVVEIKPARPRVEPTAYMPALPAVAETYVVMEMNGPTVGAQWVATATFFRGHCTRVQKDLTNQE